MRRDLASLGFTISRGGPGDEQCIVTLARATYRASFEKLWSAAGLARYLDEHYGLDRLALELSGDRTHYYLARLEDRLVGYAKLIFDRRVPVDDEAVGTELEKIYFEADAVGSGLGGAMIRHLIAVTARAGRTVIWLDVLKTNDKARRAYERQGFSVIGELPFATDLHDIGFWVMARPVSSADIPSAAP